MLPNVDMALKRMGSNSSRKMTVILGETRRSWGIHNSKLRLNQEKLVKGFCRSFAYLILDPFDLNAICKGSQITDRWKTAHILTFREP
jgi:hypothetical protein